MPKMDEGIYAENVTSVKKREKRNTLFLNRSFAVVFLIDDLQHKTPPQSTTSFSPVYYCPVSQETFVQGFASRCFQHSTTLTMLLYVHRSEVAY